MQIDINEPKSRAFNIFLRFFQFGLQILLGAYIIQLGDQTCQISYLKIVLPITYVILGLNLLSIIYIRCRDKFPRIQFFIVYIINLILAGVILILGFATAGSNQCASQRVLSRLMFSQSAIVIALSVMILLIYFGLIQRYSNSPGNLGWMILFLSLTYSDTYQGIMIVIGCLNLLISLLSFSVNLIACFNGITTTVKKIIVISWIVGLVLMIICEILAIVKYLEAPKSTLFIDITAKKLLQIFVPINILDLLFWLWGLMTLTYENGDNIRDSLMAPGQTNDIQQKNFDNSQINQNNFGTLK